MDEINHYNIFPLIEEKIESNTITYTTFVRKKHSDGKWYLNLISRSRQLYKEKDQEITNALSDKASLRMMNTEAYFFLTCGVVIPELTTQNGRQCVYLDKNQETEVERVYKLINP